MGLPEVYLYEKDTRAVTYADFVNKELVLFSNCDNERSIPCVVDGFKPGQRKVMFTCLKRNDKREVKVIIYFNIHPKLNSQRFKSCCPKFPNAESKRKQKHAGAE